MFLYGQPFLLSALHAYTHTRMHARTHARTHTHIYHIIVTIIIIVQPLGSVWLGVGFSMLLPHLPILRYPHRVNVVIRSVYQLSRIMLTCPAQIHFRLLTCSITSVTCVFSLAHIFVCFLSLYGMFNLLLSIFLCGC